MKNEKMVKDTLDLVKNDSSQLKVIQSDSKNLVVEAPAGFGKTFTMINMIKYWILIGIITNYKKVLCLSFSVSASNRMKESIESAFSEDNNKRFSRYIKATNFHGLCRAILSKYGFLVGLDGKKVYQNMDSSDKNTLLSLPYDKRKVIIDLDTSIREATISQKKLIEKIKDYNDVIRDYFLKQSKLPYNAIITLTLELLVNNNQIRLFYQKYFTAICIDEFQDTNILGLSLIRLLTGGNTKFVAFGDDMQQIYQFLGAIPSLIDKYSEESNVEYLTLKNNYRFRDNVNMQSLDCQLRMYKNDLNNTNYTKVQLNTIHGKDLSDEAIKISRFIEKHSTHKCAILFSANSKTTKYLVNCLSKHMTLFNALFKDNDQSVIDFHDKALEIYFKLYESHPITNKEITNYITEVKNEISESNYKQSLLILLKAFIKKATKEYSRDNRSEFISTTLSSYALRQSLVDINQNIILSTIHGAKGLEWDYVILANFEYNELPNYFEIKAIGNISEGSKIVSNSDNIKNIQNLINKFYVAFSRSKKEFIVSYSDMHWEGYKYKHSSISPIAQLPFIDIREIE